MADSDIKVKTEDLTGQSRFTWNLFVSWISQLVLIFSGFVMPRLVDDKIGQVALGIWDFGWAFVNYLTLIGFGMGACFNRFIAKHRAENEISLLNEVANSVIFVQLIIAFLVTVSTYLFYLLLPLLFVERLGEHLIDTQWVVIFLGLSLSIQMVSGSARGLLTGYHRWDIHNSLHAAKSLFALALMVCFLLLSDMGVMGMAFGYLIATAVFESLRFIAVRIICLEFTFDLSLAKRSKCIEMLIFGIKSMLSNLPPILLLQTINIMIVGAIGPASLAIFARPMALTKQITTFMNKFTLMLAPTAGSMQGLSNDLTSIRQLYLNTTKISFAFCLPMLGFLGTYGDVILSYWMGASYAIWPLVFILAVGQILPMSQDTSIRILMGMDQHGKISIFAFFAVLFIFSCCLLVIGTQNWALTTAALLFVIPLNLVYGFAIPLYTCRKLDLLWHAYIKDVFIMPLIFVSPFLTLIVLSRYYFNHEQFNLAIVVFVSAVIVTSYIYFTKYVPMQMKIALHKKLPKFLAH